MKLIASAFALIILVLIPVHAQNADSIRVPAQDLPPAALDTATFAFRDADLREILKSLSTQHGLNVLVDNAISKRVTVSLSRMRVHDAIRFLCKENGLGLSLENGIYRITLPPPPKVEPPAPKIPFVLFERGLLTLRYKSDDLEQTLLLVQERSGRNILLMSGTAGSLSGTLVDVDFDIGLTQILNNNGFAVQKKNNI